VAQSILKRSRCSTALLLALGVAACTKDPGNSSSPKAPTRIEETPSAPNWDEAFEYTVNYSSEKKALVVEFTVAPGYHTYTIGETIGRPLNLEFSQDSAYVAASPPSYPKGIAKKLATGTSVIVEGKGEIVAPLEKAREGQEAKGTFQYQVCTETACDRPRRVQISKMLGN
jgi:hypothetical protein